MLMKNKVRALLFDPNGDMMLFKRTRPGMPVFWKAPGGGVEETDESLKAALDRELFEELGATAEIIRLALVLEYADGNQVNFYVCHLLEMHIEQRNGPEFLDDSRGLYEIELLDLDNTASFSALNIQPPALKEFLLSGRLRRAGVLQGDDYPVVVKG